MKHPVQQILFATHHDAIHELLLLADRRGEAAAAAGPVLDGVPVVVAIGGGRVAVRIAEEDVPATADEAGDHCRGGNLLTPDRDGDGAEIVIKPEPVLVLWKKD